MSKLTDLYSNLELGQDTYLLNALNMTIFGTNYAFSKLREKVNKDTFEADASILCTALGGDHHNKDFSPV